MCSDQGIYQTRNGVARLLGLPVEKIRVQYYAGSNTYGSSCYRDVAQAAAIMSQEVGKPVRLQFSREDEFGWDNYGPALLSDLRGGSRRERQARRLRVSGVGPHRRRARTRRRSSRSARRRRRQLRRRGPAPVVAGSSRCTCRRWTCTTSRIGGSSITASRAPAICEPVRCARRWIRRRSSRWKG